jgi:hypothetical protein
MSEDDLVVRARGDRAAFAALYNQYYPLILRYCLRRLFLRELAEDTTSEVFLQIAAPGLQDTVFRHRGIQAAGAGFSGELENLRDAFGRHFSGRA